jgi:hypothetical protein
VIEGSPRQLDDNFAPITNHGALFKTRIKSLDEHGRLHPESAATDLGEDRLAGVEPRPRLTSKHTLGDSDMTRRTATSPPNDPASSSMQQAS